MITRVYLCLNMFSRYYICEPILENGAYGAISEF